MLALIVGIVAAMIVAMVVISTRAALRREPADEEDERDRPIRSVVSVSAIEQGPYSPSLEVVFRIARALGVPLEYVFGYPDDA